MNLERALLAAAFVALSVLPVACGEGSAPPASSPLPVETLAPTNLLVPPSGSIYLGVFVNPNQEQPPPLTLLSDFEVSIGRRLSLATHYYGFYDSFPGQYEINDVANGRIPIESWDCGTANAAIAQGNQDNVIRERADAIKAFGSPMFLRFMWEMNLPSSPKFRSICYDPKTDLPNGVFSPENFIAAWDRIRTIFAREGVTNVVWLWNPSGASNPLAYYPGASETDWVGFDRYDDGNVPMYQTFKQSYGWLQPLGKPILVGETGATVQEQPDFFANAVATLSGNFPQIKGLNYFDSINVYATIYSWVIPSATLSDFAAMANESYFSATEP